MEEITFEQVNEETYPPLEKEYDSLYAELLEKCNPDRFYTSESIDLQRYRVANEIYGTLMSDGPKSDNELKSLRERAIAELGIHISTIRKYKELKKYFDPALYRGRKEYDSTLMDTAGTFFARLNENRDDIHALEQLECDAKFFIHDRNIEEENERNERMEKQRRMEVQRRIEEEERKKDEKIVWIIVGGFTAIMLIIIEILAICNK